MAFEYVDDRSGLLHPRDLRDPIIVGARPVRRMAGDSYSRRLYYSGTGNYLSPEYSGLHRSRSTGPRPGLPPPAPVVINVKADEHRGRPMSLYDEDYSYDDRDRSPTVSSYSRGRSPRRYHTHSRPPSVSYSHSRDHSPCRTHDDTAEVELMRERLKKYEEDKRLEEEQKRIKDELLLKAAKEAEAKRKEDLRQKEIKEKAIEEFKKKEQERVAKEKKEKEEREKEYQERYRKDLEKLGFTNRDVGMVVGRGGVDLSKTTYTKMARRHISIETLRVYGVHWQFDEDPEYVVIKRWVPEAEQEMFWDHTRRLRESRANEERHLFILRAQEEDRARRMLEEKKPKKKVGKRSGFW
ncbi:hypothetical protein FGG08_000935 [Glutinoglossum americanum]|uniref:DUF8035 domain-containing protein n=1 Tax=Glutinoglossum americanum TaxID=1670608 RepID=A0A9P8L5T2_9PEZI|nr:hypothetical protein FGG08_000935 [Glutinoglossum americanum]